MVLPYGAVQTGDLGAHTEHHGGEHNEDSPLLGNEAILMEREGHASIISSVSNISNTIIGSGAFVFRLCGPMSLMFSDP